MSAALTLRPAFRKAIIYRFCLVFGQVRAYSHSDANNSIFGTYPERNCDDWLSWDTAPDQIDALNECFSPSPQEVAHAQRVVAAFEEAESRGRGSTSLDGWVIDVPVVKRARALLELARRAREDA